MTKDESSSNWDSSKYLPPEWEQNNSEFENQDLDIKAEKKSDTLSEKSSDFQNKNVIDETKESTSSLTNNKLPSSDHTSNETQNKSAERVSEYLHADMKKSKKPLIIILIIVAVLASIFAVIFFFTDLLSFNKSESINGYWKLKSIADSNLVETTIISYKDEEKDNESTSDFFDYVNFKEIRESYNCIKISKDKGVLYVEGEPNKFTFEEGDYDQKKDLQYYNLYSDGNPVSKLAYLGEKSNLSGHIAVEQNDIFYIFERSTKSEIDSINKQLKELKDLNSIDLYETYQGFMGTWYSNEEMEDQLIISDITSSTIDFEISMSNLTGISATAVNENGIIKFGKDISPYYEGPPTSGTIDFDKDSIKITIEESKFESIESGSVFTFSFREDNIAYDEESFDEDVIVPNLEGMTKTQAKQALEDAGLILGSVSKAESSKYSKGQVMSQDPEAGTNIAAGTTVNITICSGAAKAKNVTININFMGIEGDSNGNFRMTVTQENSDGSMRTVINNKKYNVSAGSTTVTVSGTGNATVTVNINNNVVLAVYNVDFTSGTYY